jgi:hypothetical protein
MIIDCITITVTTREPKILHYVVSATIPGKYHVRVLNR